MTPQPGPHLLGPLLAQLRLARGWSQPRLATELCVASGVPTLSRHEVSRWERQVRLPGEFWLGWLAAVLAVPVGLLADAAARTRRLDPPPALPGARSRAALLTLAQRWLADPHAALLSGPPARPGAGRPARRSDRGVPAGALSTPLAELRRLDDLAGGADLAGLGAYRMGRAARALSGCGPRSRRRLLPELAESAQLAGWLAADAGDTTGALDAYRLALRAAATAGDIPLAGHVLGSASHLLAGIGDPEAALVLARTGYDGVGRGATPGLRALLLHRVALATALAGRAATARRTLDAARRVTDAPEPDREPPWLYWLDAAELSAMAGRTLVASGRPRGTGVLLRAGRRRGRPRGAAIYGGWLARGYLQLGEVERACAVAGEALLDAVRAGSPRALRQLTEARRQLGGHGDEPAVRRYRELLAAAAPYLPRPGPSAGPGVRPDPAGGAARRPGGATGHALTD